MARLSVLVPQRLRLLVFRVLIAVSKRKEWYGELVSWFHNVLCDSTFYDVPRLYETVGTLSSNGLNSDSCSMVLFLVNRLLVCCTKFAKVAVYYSVSDFTFGLIFWYSFKFRSC